MNQAQHLDRVEAYEKARLSWLRAIELKMPRAELNRRWDFVERTAERIGIRAGEKAKT